MFENLWRRRIAKADANGIHGLLFYESNHKKIYYPTRRDEEAANPDGTRLRGELRTDRVSELRSTDRP